MEKRVSKSKKQLNHKTTKFLHSSHSFYYLLFFMILFIGISILLYFHASSLKKQYSTREMEISELKKQLKKEKKEYQVLVDDYHKYQNLDSSIEDIKKNYFKKIKEMEDAIIRGESDKKIAYLTFDDGPYYNTYRIFDILDQYDVKATFFTTNINGEYCYDNKSENCWIRYPEYLKKGHTIANHTYTHAIFRGLYNSTDSFMDAVVKQEDLVKELTGGYVTNILRFPGGSPTAKNLKDPIIERLRERGYGWVDWNAKDGDGGRLDSREQAWDIFTSSIDENIEVILFHDYNGITTEILPDAIDYLKNNGYQMFPLFYESNMIHK